MFSERRVTRRKILKNAVNTGISDCIRINVTIRRSLGSDVNAACGQLRRTHMKDLESQ